MRKRNKGIGIVVACIIFINLFGCGKMEGAGQENEGKTNLETLSMTEVFANRDIQAFEGEKRKVLERAFAISDEIIRSDMTEIEKVNVIHDYLTSHAEYYNRGELTNAPGWVYSAKGVLLKQQGVCESYALAFCMLAAAADLPCKIVFGTATTPDGESASHAWNKVYANDTWFYSDCTWDDPVANSGGGYENYSYGLSRSLWPDHVVTEEYSILDKEYSYWDLYFLTGEKWSEENEKISN